MAGPKVLSTPASGPEAANKTYVDAGDAHMVKSSTDTVLDIKVMTAAAYAALGTKVSTTLYIIVG